MININNLRVALYDEEGISTGTMSLRAYVTSMGFSGHSLVQDLRYFLEDGGYWTGNINESLKAWYETASTTGWLINGSTLLLNGDYVINSLGDE